MQLLRFSHMTNEQTNSAPRYVFGISVNLHKASNQPLTFYSSTKPYQKISAELPKDKPRPTEPSPYIKFNDETKTKTPNMKVMTE